MPDDHALRDVGELLDDRFDLERRHVRARGLDELTGAADVEQPRIAFPAVDPVAGVIPAVFVERLGPFTLVVAGHHADAADEEFADAAVGDRVRRRRRRCPCR